MLQRVTITTSYLRAHSSTRGSPALTRSRTVRTLRSSHPITPVSFQHEWLRPMYSIVSWFRASDMLEILKEIHVHFEYPWTKKLTKVERQLLICCRRWNFRQQKCVEQVWGLCCETEGQNYVISTRVMALLKLWLGAEEVMLAYGCVDDDTALVKKRSQKARKHYQRILKL